jgi:predicted transcriptional regulator
MTKRGKLEIIRDILKIISDNNNSIKFTPLLRKSNLSSERFLEYMQDLLAKRFVAETIDSKGTKKLKLSEKGFQYLEKYSVIVSFIDEFEL